MMIIRYYNSSRVVVHFNKGKKKLLALRLPTSFLSVKNVQVKSTAI